MFTLPDAAARRQILDIHTESWNPPLGVAFKKELAQKTVSEGAPTHVRTHTSMPCRARWLSG
jgi:ATP-dependent 26S proteasome regulatory subunit